MTITGITLAPGLRIEFLSDANGTVQQNDPPKADGEYDMVVKSNERITDSKHFQDVRHLVLEMKPEEVKYEPGDIAVITPQNMAAEVDLFFEQMEWSELADKQIRVQQVSEGSSSSCNQESIYMSKSTHRPYCTASLAIHHDLP